MNNELLNRVPGGPELLDWFGYAPRFHDAEVLGVTMNRENEATCSISVHGFEMTSEVDAKGFFVCTKHAVVTFVFRDLTELQLEGFNYQNAVMAIHIRRGLAQQFRMEIDPAYGLGGVIEGRSLDILIEPGIPPGSQYLKLGSAPVGQSTPASDPQA